MSAHGLQSVALTLVLASGCCVDACGIARERFDDPVMRVTRRIGSAMVEAVVPVGAIEDPQLPARWRASLSDRSRIELTLAVRERSCPARESELETIDRARSTFSSHGVFVAILHEGTTGHWLRTFRPIDAGRCLLCDASTTMPSRSRPGRRRWAVELCSRAVGR
jgi:hypothetical protein